MTITTATTSLVGDRQRTIGKVGWFFALTFALTLLLNNLVVIGENQGWWVNPGWLNGLAVAMFGGPSIAALIMASTEGRDGWRDVFSRSIRARSAPSNYALAIVLPAIPAVAGLTVSWLAGEDVGDLPGVWPEWWTLFALFLVLIPVAEEFGWRAYALPRLLAVTTPLRSSFIVGALWGLWHLPAAFFAELPQETFYFDHAWMWTIYLMLTISQSILMTWLFHRTRGSALIAGFIFHAGVNAWAGVLIADATLAGIGKDPSQLQLWVVIGTSVLLAAFVSMMTKGNLGKTVDSA